MLDFWSVYLGKVDLSVSVCMFGIDRCTYSPHGELHQEYPTSLDALGGCRIVSLVTIHP